MPVQQNPSTSMAADALTPKPHIRTRRLQRAGVEALGIVLLEPFLRASPSANTVTWSTSPTWLLVLT
jgi:hypothetical protein